MSNSLLGEKLEHFLHIAKVDNQIRAVVESNEKLGMYAAVIDSNHRGGNWELDFYRACISNEQSRMEAKGKTNL